MKVCFPALVKWRKTFGALLLLIVTSSASEFYQKIIHNTDPDAKCLDSSSPMLYLHEGGDTQKILFYFLGGGLPWNRCGFDLRKLLPKKFWISWNFKILASWIRWWWTRNSRSSGTIEFLLKLDQNYHYIPVMVLYIKETTKIQLNTKIANYSSEAPSILDLTSNGPIKSITSLKWVKS